MKKKIDQLIDGRKYIITLHVKIITVYWPDEEKWIDYKTRKSN
jgi:hypothetical protein